MYGYVVGLCTGGAWSGSVAVLVKARGVPGPYIHMYGYAVGLCTETVGGVL